mgnify:FL=1|jgi:hypothetical protein
MISAIAEHLDQFQAESNQSNDFHSRRATDGHDITSGLGQIEMV